MSNTFQLRLEQLARDGAAHHFLPAQDSKFNLFPALYAPKPRPPLKLYRCNSDFPKRLNNHGEVPSSGFYEFKNCHVGKSGTIINEDRKVLYDDDLTSSYWLLHVSKLISKASRAKNKLGENASGQFICGADGLAIELTDQPGTLVNLMKPGPNVYGHWILDTLPMTFHFFEMAKRGLFEKPYRFIVSASTPEWAKAFLKRLFNIEESSLVVFDDDTSVLRVKRVITPSLMRVSPLISPRMNDFVSFVHSKLAVDFVKNSDRPTPRQFFISRKSFNIERRHLVNIAEIENFLQSAGVELIQPERLTWRDQIRMFYNADIVIGEYGSGLHGTLFSPASTVPIVLFNGRSNFNQTSIAATRNQDIIYIKPSEESLLAGNRTEYTIDVEDLGDALWTARHARSLA